MQLDDGLVALVQSRCQCDHDVTLLLQQRFVAIHLSLVLFDLLALSLDLNQFLVVLLANYALLLLESRPELGSVLYFAAAYQHLAVHVSNFLLQDSALFLSLQEFL